MNIVTALSLAPETQRLFFAIWPELELSRKLYDLVGNLLHSDGRCVAPESIHLTLAFLGSREASFRQCVTQAASVIRIAPFTLTLRQVGHWAKSGILWVGPVQTPEPLLRLVRKLNAVLAPCGYVPEKRPYAAHLTLARKVRSFSKVKFIEPLQWQVGQFCLVQSKTHAEGTRYEILHKWEFG